MAEFSEARRLFSYDGPHAGELFVNAISGSEEIDELFKFDLELISENALIVTEDMLGKNVTIGIRHRDGVSFRYFNGHLSHFSPVRSEGRLAIYSAQLVPWVWFLTLSNGCHIFQEKTVPEVIDETFSRYGFRDYDVSGIHELHKPWEYCCQYQESAWDFVARLMEIEGIYYYFKHENGKHTLVLVDNMAALLPCPYQSTIRYDHQAGTGLYRTEDTISSSDLKKVVKPNVYENSDSNFRIYQNPLHDKRSVGRDTGVDRDIDCYFYPANVEWAGEPSDYAMLRIEEQEHDHTAAGGSGNARAMTPGYKFDLTEHDRPEQDLNYLIVKVTHYGHEGTFVAGANSQEAVYTNSFVAHPSSITYRPHLDTEEPQISSLQTATVIGPPGEEIYTDKYGRVRVKFHWDRRSGNENGNASCWIRVAQQWGGPNFGYIWIPRVGMEVAVQFINGDPDRPLITGCVYNNLNPVPYPLPANKEWSGIKSRSTKGGTPDNYNELRMVDSIGNELLRMQAEKDFHVFVKNDRSELILKDRFLDVGGDKHDLVDGDKFVTISKGVQEIVAKDFKIKIGGDATLSVSGGQTEEIKGDKNITVDGDFAEDIQGDTSIHNEGDFDQKVDGDGKLTADGDLHIKSNGKLVIEGSSGFTLKCGGAFIDISNGIITIQGTKILLNCGSSADGADAADPDDPDTPDDFSNSNDARFKSPAGDFPLPDNEPDPTGSPAGPAAGGAGADPAMASESNAGTDDSSSSSVGSAAGAAAGGASAAEGGGNGSDQGVGGAMGGAAGAAAGAAASDGSNDSSNAGDSGAGPANSAPAATESTTDQSGPANPLSDLLANNPWVAQTGVAQTSPGKTPGATPSNPAKRPKS